MLDVIAAGVAIYASLRLGQEARVKKSDLIQQVASIMFAMGFVFFVIESSEYLAVMY